jgi:hypothetical protein
MEEYLYTEDQIVKVGDTLKGLKGKILLDDRNEFYVLKDYDIKAVSTLNWDGFFKPKKPVQMFFIDFIILSGEEDHKHSNDTMCTMTVLTTLQRYHANYTALQAKLIKFTLKNNIILKFGELTVSTNKSSNFKRR